MNSVMEIGEKIVFKNGGWEWEGSNKEILKPTTPQLLIFVYSKVSYLNGT